MIGRRTIRDVVALSLIALAVAPRNAAALTEAEGRRLILPYIRSLTDCIATHIRINAKPLKQARAGNWSDAIGDTIGYCEAKGVEMIAAHDQLFGRGTGVAFLKGAYLTDLPRALRTRLQGEFGAGERAEQAERERVSERERHETAALDAKKQLVAEAVAAHEECLVTAIGDLAPYSAESAPTLADVALDRCAKFAERRISIGVAAFDMTREEAQTIVDRKVAELRTKMISAVVTARAEAAKKQGRSDAPTTSQGLPKAQPL